MKTCPGCDNETLRDDEARNSLSRYHKGLYICAQCGKREALEGAFLTVEQSGKLSGTYLGDDFPVEVVLEYISDTGDDDLHNIEEAYSGQHDSDQDFAMEMAEELGSVDLRNQPWPQYCIDWEYAARELMMDYSVYVAANYKRYYFRNL